MTTANTSEDLVLCGDGIRRPPSGVFRDYGRVGWPAGTNVRTWNGHTVSSLDPAVVPYGGGWYFRSEMTTLDGEEIPLRLTFTCHGCGERGNRNDRRIAPDGRSRCHCCHDDSVTGCDECCSECMVDDVHERDGNLLCPDCFNPGVLGYSDRAANRLTPESKDTLLYGIELEVESEESLNAGVKYIRQWLTPTYCVLKRDGSLSETGVEIVTRPDSMAVHRKQWQKFFDDSPGRALTSWANGRCGMHVHVSKAALSQLQLGKMLCFLNDPANQNMIAKIAGRSKSRWCRVYKKKISDVCHGDGDRYVALNITERTAEFRIFKGTLHHAGFLKNLEFVESLVAFCGPAQRSIADATSYRSFCDWLPKKEYPNLHAFLTRKGFLRRRRNAA